jgi:hypothetical protein
MKKLSVFVLILTAFGVMNGCASYTPLSAAIEKDDANAVKDLLAKGANPCEKGTDGFTSFEKVIFNGYSCRNETYRILIDNAYELFNKGGQCQSLLYYAASGGCNDIVQKLLEKGYDPNEVYDKIGKYTALSGAAYNGQLETTKILINKGADLDLAADGLKIFASRQLPYLAYHRNKEIYDKANLGVETINRLRIKQVEPTTIAASRTAPAPVLGKSIIKSDIDELPAIKIKHNKNAYAIVIGIENYRQKLPKADFATRDAKLMSEYLSTVLGYPEENVITLLNDHASNVDLVKYFEGWLPNNVEKDSTVFIYYSGHGAPNTKTGDAYLVPYDGDPSFIEQTGYPLKKLYEFLNKLPAKEITVALDSCFSGAGGKSVIAKGARPLVMNLQNNINLSNNMTIMTASSGNQTSSTYDEKGHGLFTYFMLKGIKNEDVVKRDGTLNIKELYAYIKPQVERIARRQYNNEQTPQLMGVKRD